MKITVIGTGYVGLVTGVSLSEIGHDVTCIDIDERKVEQMRKGLSPIFEPGLEDMMKRNIGRHRLAFETSYEKGLAEADVIFIARFACPSSFCGVPTAIKITSASASPFS